jgi:D-alanyl-D-alanine carboxypeptidase
MLLAEDGQLDLDAPVQSIIPGLVGEPAMTTRQLLQHTAGFFDLGNDGDPVAALQAIPDPSIVAEAMALFAQWQAGEAVMLPAETLVRATDTQPRYFQPGLGYHYSNPGYQLVGMVLTEASSGLSLGELLQQRVAEPNDLATMSLAPWDSTSPELRGSGPELDEAGVAVDNTDDLFTFGNGGNGGLLTTADDLARFFRLLLGGEIVTAESLEDMITATEPSIRRASAYGLGLGLYGLSCGVFYGHGGAVNGTESIALADAGGERVVVVVFNSRIAGRDAGLLALAETLVCGTD